MGADILHSPVSPPTGAAAPHPQDAGTAPPQGRLSLPPATRFSTLLAARSHPPPLHTSKTPLPTPPLTGPRVPLGAAAAASPRNGAGITTTPFTTLSVSFSSAPAASRPSVTSLRFPRQRAGAV